MPRTTLAEPIRFTEDGFALYYKVIKAEWGSCLWWVEVWASRGGQTAKIRPGNTPYTTKGQAAAAGEAKLNDLATERIIR